MKHLRRSLFTVFLLSISLLIIGCSNEPTTENYIAKVSDFEDNIFSSSQNQSIGLREGELRVSGIYDKEAKIKTSLDDIISTISLENGDQRVKTFSNVKITTDKDKYTITADDGINLVFTKVGKRIIKDEKGVEYRTAKQPE